jgi:D-arabinose 1-dehydrogenase-like Zn-dependent alcohol dehydrogenase
MWNSTSSPHCIDKPADFRQLLKAVGVGQQQKIIGLPETGQRSRAAGLEHFERRAVRGVFQHQRADHAHAVLECAL